MTARDLMFATLRRSLGVTGTEAPRRVAVAARLAGHPRGVVPARGQLPPQQRLDLFTRMLEAASATTERVASATDIPAAVATFLRGHNLPLRLRRGGDPRLDLPWETAPALEVLRGPSDGHDLAAVSHAFTAVAETGTVVLASGPDNPTTLNFLPDVHIVVVDASDIGADFETAMARLRSAPPATLLGRPVEVHDLAPDADVVRLGFEGGRVVVRYVTSLYLARRAAP